jgi:hypothetical protein
LELYCGTSLLRAQPTSTFEPACTLRGHRLYAVLDLDTDKRKILN